MLDRHATVGSIGHGSGPGGNTGSFTIQRDAIPHVLTMDNTGGISLRSLAEAAPPYPRPPVPPPAHPANIASKAAGHQCVR
ncbi:MAG: hypothetical protein J0M04_16095 [Verrucomicrobia bacterium]|nr:hypothetical protein [Verrucomicrobiota bacterium]